MAQSSYSAELYDDLMRRVDFSLRDDKSGLSRPLKPSVRKYLEKWLLQRATACRLQPAWTDLGAMFWPRWVRRGNCGEDVGPRRRRGGNRRPSSSCSWPPGMRCVPEASQTIRLLRWRCKPTTSARRLRADKTRPEAGRGLRRRRRGRRSRHKDATTKNGDLGRAASEWKWHCSWKRVPYAVTVACFCSC